MTPVSKNGRMTRFHFRPQRDESVSVNRVIVEEASNDDSVSTESSKNRLPLPPHPHQRRQQPQSQQSHQQQRQPHHSQGRDQHGDRRTGPAVASLGVARAVDAMFSEASSQDGGTCKADLCPICSVPLQHQDVAGPARGRKVILCQSSSSLRNYPIPHGTSSVGGMSFVDEDLIMYDFDSKGGMMFGRSDMIPLGGGGSGPHDIGVCGFLLPFQSLMDELAGVYCDTLCDGKKPNEMGLMTNMSAAQDYRMIPPYCQNCNAYIVLESTTDREQELMLNNLTSWLARSTSSDEERSLQSKDTDAANKPNQGKITVVLESGTMVHDHDTITEADETVSTKLSTSIRPHAEPVQQPEPLEWSKIMQDTALRSPHQSPRSRVDPSTDPNDNELSAETRQTQGASRLFTTDRQSIGKRVLSPSRTTSPRSRHRRLLMEEEELEQEEDRRNNNNNNNNSGDKATCATYSPTQPGQRRNRFAERPRPTPLINMSVSPTAASEGSPTVVKEVIAHESPGRKKSEVVHIETGITYSIDDEDLNIEVEALARKIAKISSPSPSPTVSSFRDRSSALSPSAVASAKTKRHLAETPTSPPRTPSPRKTKQPSVEAGREKDVARAAGTIISDTTNKDPSKPSKTESISKDEKDAALTKIQRCDTGDEVNYINGQYHEK